MESQNDGNNLSVCQIEYVESDSIEENDRERKSEFEDIEFINVPKFPYSIQYFHDVDSLITPEESEERINVLLIISSLILSFFYVLLFIWVLGIASKIKGVIYLEPDLSKPQVVGFPIPHFGIVNQFGTFSTFISPLLDPRYEKSISVTKVPDYIVKIDKHRDITAKILVFSSQNDIFFVYGNSERPVIKYDTKENNHKTIPKSNIPEHQRFTTRGTLLGKYFFAMGGSYYLDEINENNRTNLWSVNKQKWFSGPIIPDSSKFYAKSNTLIQDAFDVENVCIVAVNDSTVYILGKESFESYMISLNILSQTWQKHAPMPIYNTYTGDCIHHISKQLKKKIVALEVNNYSGYPNAILIYDIDESSWETFYVHHGRGLLNIQNAIFLIDYSTSPEGRVTTIEFIPFDIKKGFQYENRVVRETKFRIPIASYFHYTMFAKPVTFLLRNFE